MNQTSLLGRTGTNCLRLNGLTSLSSICVAIMFVLGTLNAEAQTMIELGELKSAELFRYVQDEMDNLEIEIKNPSSGVITDYNEPLIKYYKRVLLAFDAGSDFKEALKQHPGKSMADFFPDQPEIEDVTTTGQDVPSIVPTPSEYLQLLGLISNLDLFDNDSSDLDDIFEYWRTLKNQ